MAIRVRQTRRIRRTHLERRPQRRASRFCRVSSGVPPSDGARPSLRRTKAATPRALPRSMVVARRDRTRRVRLRLAPARALVGGSGVRTDVLRRIAILLAVVHRSSVRGVDLGRAAIPGGRGGSTPSVERYGTEEKPSLEGTAGIAVALSERKPSDRQLRPGDLEQHPAARPSPMTDGQELQRAMNVIARAGPGWRWVRRTPRARSPRASATRWSAAIPPIQVPRLSG